MFVENYSWRLGSEQIIYFLTDINRTRTKSAVSRQILTNNRYG